MLSVVTLLLTWSAVLGSPPTSAAGPTPAADTSAPAPSPAPAAQPAPPPVAEPVVLPPMDDLLNPVKEVVAGIEALERTVERVRTSDAGLSQQRADLDVLWIANDRAADGLRPRLDASRAQIEKLGPARKPGEAAEAPEIAAERARLTAIVTTLEGALKSTELVRVRARQLATNIQDLRQTLFTQNLFERSASPMLPGLWQQIAAGTGLALHQVDSVFGPWWTILTNRWPTVLALLIGSGLLYLILWTAKARILERVTPRLPTRAPSFTARATAAAISAPLYFLPFVAAATVLYMGVTGLDLTYGRIDGLVGVLYQGVIVFAVVSGLASAILTPAKPSWRLLDLADRAAIPLWRHARAVALVYVADIVLKEAFRLLGLPLPFHVALSFATALAFAIVLIRVVATPFQPTPRLLADAPDPRTTMLVSRWTPRWLKLPLLAVALGIALAALAGYIALSRFVAGQVVITGSAVVLVMLVHLAIRTLEKATVSPSTLIGSWLERGMGLSETHRSLVGNVVSAVLHVVLATLALPGLLLAWGFSTGDVIAGLRSALFGFEIGTFRVSLAQLFMALALFAALLFVTRLLQRWLQGTFLRPDRMDPGIANSIYQGIGYVGFALAALVSVSFGGIDITNLAIVAGALSVGIGFGLQSIVNNFVSGLILLVERPIKVGDWIVLKGGGEGYVRSISVRSTEIETFDRSSLIVPNSELISNVVTNWTHRNALGRVVVKIAVSYQSDPEKVLELLTACARTTPQVLSAPAPLISFDNFGDEGLEFTVRVVVADINRGLGVKTALLTAIFKAFREHNIAFPTAERDVTLRVVESDGGGLRAADGRGPLLGARPRSVLTDAG